MTEFYPDIDDYLDEIDDNFPVSAQGLEELSAKICASTGLSRENASIIVKEFFQQIRNEVLNGNFIDIKNIGKFYIIKNKNKNKKQLAVRFKQSKEFKRKINNEY